MFAAARAASGRRAATVDVQDDATLGDALDALVLAFPSLADLLGRCTFLVDGVAAADRGQVLAGRQLDILPPFAGG